MVPAALEVAPVSGDDEIGEVRGQGARDRGGRHPRAARPSGAGVGRLLSDNYTYIGSPRAAETAWSPYASARLDNSPSRTSTPA